MSSLDGAANDARVRVLNKMEETLILTKVIAPDYTDYSYKNDIIIMGYKPDFIHPITIHYSHLQELLGLDPELKRDSLVKKLQMLYNEAVDTEPRKLRWKRRRETDKEVYRRLLRSGKLLLAVEEKLENHLYGRYGVKERPLYDLNKILYEYYQKTDPELFNGSDRNFSEIKKLGKYGSNFDELEFFLGRVAEKKWMERSITEIIPSINYIATRAIGSGLSLEIENSVKEMMKKVVDDEKKGAISPETEKLMKKTFSELRDYLELRKQKLSKTE